MGWKQEFGLPLTRCAAQLAADNREMTVREQVGKLQPLLVLLGSPCNFTVAAKEAERACEGPIKGEVDVLKQVSIKKRVRHPVSTGVTVSLNDDNLSAATE
jgi:hypothetical protein